MIQVHDLVKVYGTKEALRSVRFEIPSGQVCGYLGPNGAGKSTTVKILTGVLRPTSGRAVVAGFEVGEQPLEVKRCIGYVPETGAVYPMLGVNEYLALVGALHRLDPPEIAERSKRLLSLFKILDAQDQRLATLSKGMRQKVVISAAVLHDPEVLLFDEPLSGLDANAARTIKDLVRDFADRGKTVLYCSHMLDVVERLCDRVIILDQGQIVADGSPAALMASSQRDTLETVFRSLTGGDDTKELAEALLDAVQHDRDAAGRASPGAPSPRHDVPTPSPRHGQGEAPTISANRLSADGPWIDRALRWAGIEPRASCALLHAYLLTDFRNQQFGRATRSGPKAWLAPLFWVVGQNLLLGFAMGVILYARVDGFFFALANLAVSMLVMATAVIVEFNEVVLDPEDLEVAGHLPVPARTYSAARHTLEKHFVMEAPGHD